MNRNIYLTVFSILLFFSYSYCQPLAYTQFGEVELVIKLKTERSNFNVSSVSKHNPIFEGDILFFKKEDEQTYKLKTKTFGPTSFFFMIDRVNPISAVLYPGMKDTLIINYDSKNNFELDYIGFNKNIAINSKTISQILMDAHNLGNAGIDSKNKNSLPTPFKTANEFRDHYIQYINSRIDAVTKNEMAPEVNNFCSQYISNTFKSIFLTKNYYNAIKFYNLEIGLDSSSAITNIPKRTQNYFESIIGSEIIDKATLIAPGYANLLHDLRNDSLIQLPNILEVTILEYKEKLIKFFYPILNSKENFFYDFMIAGAFIDQLYKGNRIDNEKIKEINTFFQNKDISDYILNMNEEISKENNNKSFHFPYPNLNGDQVFDTILTKYVNKVIIVDFWATWCGPCIEAFSEIKKLKELYKENEDIVFIYLTNESSDFKMWRDYTNEIDGEHYYISNNQMQSIYKKIGIQAIPYYLVVNRNNEIIHNSGNKGYMGNVTLKNWIEEALQL